MTRWVLLLLVMVGAVGCVGARAEQTSPDLALLDVRKVAPQVVVDLRYATAENFTGKVLYPKSARCYLQQDVAEALLAVDKALRAEGLGLKVFDCYRPRRVQFLLWEIVADERYVADPKKGFVTIGYRDGCEPELTPLKRALVQLTAVGCNLAEGDVDDPGVLFGDGRRA